MIHPRDPRRVPQLGELKLDGWSVYQDEGVLRSADRVVRLEPRVMDVLVYLAAEPGAVVPKEEILEAVWGGAYVEEGVLAQAIHSLRKALGDDARQPRFIQTIPKRGYRLVAPVERIEAIPEPVTPSEPIVEHPAIAAPSRWRGWLLVVVALIAVTVATFWLTLSRSSESPRDSEPAPVIEGISNRIVVLPFENVGPPENAYFAEGLTDEITKDLSSIHSLEVISRTSAVGYQDARKSLQEIGKELGVTYVLEGTVRWARGPGGKPRVRITPRLIRVADDAQIWTSAYERDVGDIFAVQEEISRRVIGSLGITLMPEENQVLGEMPTESLEAYRAYVRGRVLKNQPSYSEEHLEKAALMFERAVQLDPDFAPAWAELSQVHSYLAFNTDRSPSRIQQARQALERSVSLAPHLPDVQLAQIYFSYRCLEDFDKALEQLTPAARLYPNNAEILETLGLVLRRKGQLPEAIEAFRRASKLDPRTGDLIWDIAETFRALREYEQADRAFAQALSLAPDVAFFWEQRALNQRAWTGDPKAARAIINDPLAPSSPELEAVAFQLDLDERKYKQALARLTTEHVKRLPLQDQSRLATWAVIAHERLGDQQSALVEAEKNRTELEKRTQLSPKEPMFRAYLALTLAQLGHRAEALDQAEKAVAQSRHDRFSGPRTVEIQAMVEATLGRHDEAASRLAELLSMSYRYSLSTADLKLNPVWDPLRSTRGFQILLQEFPR